MSLRSTFTALGAAGATIAVLAMVGTSTASAQCINPCHIPPPTSNPPPPRPLSITANESDPPAHPPIPGAGLTATAGGTNQVGSASGPFATFTASGPGTTPVTVAATDATMCMGLLGQDEFDEVTPYTATGTGTVVLSFWVNNTCPAGYEVWGSAQRGYATQGNLTTPTVTLAWEQ